MVIGRSIEGAFFQGYRDVELLEERETQDFLLVDEAAHEIATTCTALVVYCQLQGINIRPDIESTW